MWSLVRGVSRERERERERERVREEGREEYFSAFYYSVVLRPSHVFFYEVLLLCSNREQTADLSQGWVRGEDGMREREEGVGEKERE